MVARDFYLILWSFGYYLFLKVNDSVNFIQIHKDSIELLYSIMVPATYLKNRDFEQQKQSIHNGFSQMSLSIFTVIYLILNTK